MVTPAAVLFDMDGTLVDSEKVWYFAVSELAAVIGGRLSPGARTAIIGSAMTEAVAIVHRDLDAHGRDVTADIAWLEHRVHAALLTDGLTWRPGAREMVVAVRKAGIPTALVTSSARRITDAAMSTLGSENFDVVITRDDVTRPKPDPQPYVRAAVLLDVPITACVAIEDSGAGVRSAHAAGASVLAISSGQNLPTGEGIQHLPSLEEVDVAFLTKALRTPGRLSLGAQSQR